MAETNSKNDKYLVQLRRELVRAQARLKRAERECERLRAENERLKELLKTAKTPRARPS
jgi:phage shock protein A